MPVDGVNSKAKLQTRNTDPFIIEPLGCPPNEKEDEKGGVALRLAFYCFAVSDTDEDSEQSGNKNVYVCDLDN